MNKRTEVLLIAVGFAFTATLCTGITSHFVKTFDTPLGMLWMFAHFPAMIAYVGTLAEHDPLQGAGFVMFALVQWGVIGLGVGWIAATVRRARRA
jgi:hypothetical protein